MRACHLYMLLIPFVGDFEKWRDLSIRGFKIISPGGLVGK